MKNFTLGLTLLSLTAALSLPVQKPVITSSPLASLMANGPLETGQDKNQI